MHKHVLAGAILALAGGMMSAHADPVAGQTVRGTINDALGRPVPGAAVSATLLGGTAAGSTSSDATGHFLLGPLAPGAYQLSISAPGFQAAAQTVTVGAQPLPALSLTLASSQALAVVVKRHRVERPRNDIAVETGSSSYRMSQQDLKNLPQGQDTALNQVILQAPGVVQDSFGQLHVRGDHGDLQYRLNGVILPESISGFGQSLDTRFLKSVTLLTGALPAQYGYRTAGVIEMQTQEGRQGQGGDLSLTAGSYHTAGLDGDVYGGSGRFNYYVGVGGLRNDIGVENPVAARDALHDHTQQARGFGYFSWLTGVTSRLSVILGSTGNRFQIPANPGQPSSYQDGGFSSANYPSAMLQDNQQETTHYGIVAFQSTLGDQFDYQVSLFNRYTAVQYNPDVVGDLVYSGSATRVNHSGWASGVQADGSYRLDAANTLRLGSFLSEEKLVSDNFTYAFPANPDGSQSSTTPVSFAANDNRLAYLEGFYLQNEWKASQKLTLNYGARYDEVNAYVRGGQLSPRLGAVYQLSPDTTLHAGYARYFTPPPTELVTTAAIAQAQGTTLAPALAANDPVRPERDDYFDAGLSHRLTAELTLGLDAYLKNATHLLDEGQFGPAMVFTPFNYARGRVSGQELTLNFRREEFSAYFNLAHAVALGKDIESSQYTFASQAQLDYISQHWIHLDHDETLSASGGLSCPWRGTTWGADFIAGSGLRNDSPDAPFSTNGTHLPGYTQVNLSARRNFDLALLGRIEGRLSVVNALDRIYQIHDGSGVGVGAPQYGPHRSYYLTLDKSF